MKYRAAFLEEVKRFDACGRQPGSPKSTDTGLEQFFEFESYGKMPENPDRYYTHLCDGKAWWEWTLNLYASQYTTFEWPGWYQLAIDFIDDTRGFRQLRQRLYFEPIDPDKFLDEENRRM